MLVELRRTGHIRKHRRKRIIPLVVLRVVRASKRVRRTRRSTRTRFFPISEYFPYSRAFPIGLVLRAGRRTKLKRKVIYDRLTKFDATYYNHRRRFNGANGEVSEPISQK